MSQKEFSEALLNAEHPVPEDMVDPQGRPAGKRFNVYRNNVVSSLSDALAEAYPVVQKLVGEKFFKAMAGVFVRQYPPQSPILFRFAPEFPISWRPFLRSQSSLTCPMSPALSKPAPAATTPLMPTR